MKTRLLLLFTLLLVSVSTVFSQNNTILYDKFDNTSYGWTESNTSDNRYDIYNGNYTIQHKTITDRAYTAIDGRMKLGADFEMSTNLTHVSGETEYATGLIFGGKNASNHYSFAITYTGYFRLSKVENGVYVDIMKWTENAAVTKGTGSMNKLSIINKGNYIYFYVNDKHVHSELNLPLFGTQIGFDLYNKQTINVDGIWVLGEKSNNITTKTEEVIFEDLFNNNAKNWPNKMQGGVDMYMRGGKYYFHHKRNESAWMTNQQMAIDESRDFYVEASIQKISGEENYGHGLIWGFKDWKNYFSFNTTSTGFFRVSKEENNEWTNIKGWTVSSAVNKGNRATNVLKMAKVGNMLKFYINGDLVFETNYERMFGDRIGFEIHKRQELAIDYLKVAYTGTKSVVTRNTPPVIIITEPSNTRDFNIVKATTVRVAGKAIDSDGISSVTINGKYATVYSDGSFSSSISVNGSQVVTVIAKDKKGLSSNKNFSITVQQQTDITDNVDPITEKIQKRLALVIGNANYTGAGSLKNPVNDARSMKIALEELGFDVLKYENCDQRMMKRAIDEFGKELVNYDIGFFFYAGHGLQVTGANYLIPVDAQLQNENDVEYDCVRADRVMAKMETANAKTNIIVLDACRNNPFERSWARSTNGSGLAFMNAPQGSLIAYATAPGNTAADGEGNNGLYTSSLLKHIKTPNIGIESVFKKVRQDVIKSSGGQQTPWESTSLTGDFYFKK